MAKTTKELANEIAHIVQTQGQRIIAAESCTGGLVASALTNGPGSSAWFEGGYVTYTLESKTAMLGISAADLKNHGAVSRTVATMMANNALDRSSADYSIAVTGLAGPEGDGTDTTVGTIWVGFARRHPHWVGTHRYAFKGSRSEIRNAAVTACLEHLLELCRDNA